MSHTFKAGQIADPEAHQEFSNLQRALNEAQPEFSYFKRNAEPARVWDGLTLYADGTNWDPGSGEGLYRYGGGAWHYLEGSGGGSGTVTTVSVVSANGFAGTVATAGTTPAITVKTTITGILKGDGTAVSAAVAGDFPTLNQNTTGSAAKWTTARNLAGNSVDGSANVAFANKFIVQGTTDTGLSAAQFLGALGTGIVKNTTTTGVLSIAVAADFPTLNQNTTGSAATLTTPRAIYGNNFDGSAALTAIIASTFGGTGNGFTKFSGPATSEKTFTLPNVSVTLPGIQSSVLIIKQPAPASKAAGSTLTAAEMLGRLALYTGAASTLTTTTGTLLDAAVTMAVDEAFEFIINNTGSGTCTFTMGAGMTASGTMTVAAGTSQHFTIRKTAANAFTVYRA